MEKIACVTTTLPQTPDAEHIAHQAVAAGVAACCHFESIKSYYTWNAEVRCDAEYRLTLKTSVARKDALLEWLAARHPYEVPMLLARDEDASIAYAQWVRSVTDAL